MYIAKVEVLNFKSYRDKTVLEGLTPGLNVFIGQNGSGKSNLLQAVEFVLKGNRNFFRFHQRLHVLSDGCDGLVSVQIVLGDCDPALGLGGRLSLKREMHARGFDFFVNNCKTSSKNFYRLLEICGFSTGVEYYFVNKNLLKTFITFSPEQKLDFLISNLGMAFYKSVKSIKEVLHSIEETTLRVSSFQDHLAEISVFYKHANMKELKKWKQYKALCECKAYLMAQIQLNCLVKMRKKEIGFEGQTVPCTKSKAEYKKNCVLLQKTSTLLEELKQTYLLTNTLLEDTEHEILDLSGKQTQVELKINDLNEKGSVLMKSAKEEISDDVIQQLTLCLADEETKIKEETDMLNNLKKQLDMAENERALIIGKMGRQHQFPNKDSRDRWLNESILALKNKIKYEQETINEFKKTVLNLKELKEKYLNEIKVAELCSQNINRDEEQKRKYALEYSSLQMELNELQREENILGYDIQNLQKSINFKKIELIKKIGRNVVEGIESVKKVIDLEKNDSNSTNFQMMRGYLGTVIESFKCDDNLNEAIDATVGKFMFSHIVKTDSIGTQILQEMKKLNLPGEAQFIPLNRIITKDTIQTANDDAMPLIKLLSFTDKVEKAVRFCFGGILICKNIEVCVELAKTYECTCVTIDGDMVKKSGILTGGYRPKKLSLRSIFNDILQQESKISEKYQKLEYNTQKANYLLQQMNKIQSELQKLIAKAKIKNGQQSVAGVSSKIKFVSQEIESVRATKRRKEEEIKQLFRNLLNLELELKEPFGTQYIVDSSGLKRLNKTIIELTEKVNDRQLVVLSKEKHKNEIENKIDTYKSHKTEAHVEYAKLTACQNKLKDYNMKRDLINKRLHLLKNRVEDTKAKIENIQQTENEYKNEIVVLEQKIDEYKYSKQYIDLSVSLQNILDLDDKIKECLRYMSKYRRKFKKNNFQPANLTTKKINEELMIIKNKIKDLGNIKDIRFIIKKCSIFKKIETYTCNIFSNLCAFNVELMKLKEWLENHISLNVIKISNLFNSYFDQLVPNSRVCLNLETNEEEIWTAQRLIMNLFTSGDSTISSSPISLSGSQKTCLLISLVLALAKVQNFRICLMDEIDQYLTDENIDLLNRLLSELNDMQFFAASHRRSFIQKGDNLFIVKNHLNRSFVNRIENEATELEKLLGTCSCPYIPEDSSISEYQF